MALAYSSCTCVIEHICLTAFCVFPQIYFVSKFDEYTPCGYLETELNATGEYFAYAQATAHEKILHKLVL